MTFILSKQRGADSAEAFRLYREYLERLKPKFPKGAYSLGTSDWFYNPEDHRCPHDAWLENLSLYETAAGERNEIRTTSMCIRLLGAYHDGFVEFRYARVFGYQLELSAGASGHRDWLYDEFRLSETGNVVHEIEWAGFAATGRWIVEASDVEFVWLPNK
jgi:hypothetical protein